MAAGSGRRFGQPKALVDSGSGPWVLRAVDALAGCDRIVVVIGAEADAVREILPPTVEVLVNPDHLTGMGSSLRAGLTAIGHTPAAAAVVMLVDLPDVGRAVVDRLLAHLDRTDPSRSLSRAAYQGRPGHPVLIGREHFDGVITGAVGDSGAREYLGAHGADLIECGDLGGGRDVDRPDQL
nr:nucleotidyltransferase family protein [Nakamurella panacisegetis]